MDLNFLAALSSVRPFEHRWLGAGFTRESREQAEHDDTKKQHYVPAFYLQRWAVDGKVQPFQVDSRTAHPPQLVRDVGKAKNIYTLPEYGATMDLPLRWVEKHLSRIEGLCSQHLDALVELDSGLVTDDALRQDMSVFLGLQITRTPSQRERHLALINGPAAAKREYLKRTSPGANATEVAQRMRPRFTDPKHEAIHLMIEDVRYPVGPLLHRRKWAVYRTNSPLVTCDDPVLFLAGPPFERSVSLAGSSAVVLYPLDPSHLLVMLRWDMQHRGPLVLDVAETAAVNLEIVAAATRTSFERPGDDIASECSVPIRVPIPELDDETAQSLETEAALQYLFGRARRVSRWADSTASPDWPVPRWYSS
ncbi:DUF4238 domain-containing protein [Nocardia cyriacigeorgica]|uniref:DUF4238 domain-containing protein n=1 Tax=Nocardia cyriacigeorgica TaxID=135487 RepID=UPI00148720A4|nr:DUF4238 domain-containing protein [Nocardia cyriacigeorgica]MBF6093974.1 DUF4238 domain-containing protein [Nocardia cyriacigeorgica]